MNQKRENAHKTLLFVDDEADFRNALAFTFHRKGYRVLTAASGNEAFKILQTISVSAVISDIRMPDGSGLDLLKQVKAKIPDTPVVLLVTGFADITTEDAYSKGARALLSKPFNSSMLEETIEALLDPKKQMDKTKLQVELSFQHAAAAVRSHASNVGPNGMFLVLDRAACPNINDEVAFRILADDQKTFAGNGIVRWIRTPPSSDGLSGFGVEFTYLGEAEREQLLALVSKKQDQDA